MGSQPEETMSRMSFSRSKTAEDIFCIERLGEACLAMATAVETEKKVPTEDFVRAIKEIRKVFGGLGMLDLHNFWTPAPCRDRFDLLTRSVAGENVDRFFFLRRDLQLCLRGS